MRKTLISVCAVILMSVVSLMSFADSSVSAAFEQAFFSENSAMLKLTPVDEINVSCVSLDSADCRMPVAFSVVPLSRDNLTHASHAHYKASLSYEENNALVTAKDRLRRSLNL